MRILLCNGREIRVRTLAIICAVLVMSGCATQASLTILSQPEGAYLTEKGSGKVFGVAPVVVAYDANALANHKRADGCYLVQGFEARWVSGATASVDHMTLCGSSTGAYTITFSRAPNYPDLQRDLQFALQIQAIRAQQQQARAAQDAAAAAQARAAQEAARARTAQNAAALRALNAAPINCTSTQMGHIVQTNCY